MDTLPIIIVVVILCLILYLVYRQTTAIRQTHGQNAALLAQLTDVQTQTITQAQEITRMQQEMAKADALILKLREQIAVSDSSMNSLQQSMTEHEKTNSSLVTQLQQIEKESAQSKALFSTVANVAFDLVLVLNEDMIIIALNKSSDSLFGARNPVGEKLSDVLDAPDLINIIEHAFGENESLEEQFVLDSRYFRARTQVMSYADGASFIGLALQDITQLVRLNRARRDMVANISHELRTPIANIRMIIEGLFHDQNRPKRKASIASLRSIARETEVLQWTVQELLDLSMIESGQSIMKLVEEPLHEIIEEAIERMGEKLNSKHLSISQHVPAKLHVLCDREHIRRVFINLISNAVKWSPANNTITISAAHVHDEVTISLFDNGPGVPDDQRDRIFERFYQVDTARSGAEGSGLGLAICKHIVEAHGGTIWAEGNAQGAGGRFLFTLLSAQIATESIAPMDRGQHDAVLNPYVQKNFKSSTNNMIDDLLDDNLEIEFIDDDDDDERA